VATAQAEGLATCILRFGMFYAADSAQTQGMLSTIEAGGFPILGAGQNYWNMIHVDDAARAVVSAVKHRNDLGGATLDLADDQPVTMADLINELARMTGGPKPRSVPVWLSRVLIGGHVVDYLLSSVRCRNQAAKEALQLNLKYPTYLAGFNSVISELQNS
jgi:NAD dependent epimerase/dehydratase family enzyme